MSNTTNNKKSAISKIEGILIKSIITSENGRGIWQNATKNICEEFGIPSSEIYTKQVYDVLYLNRENTNLREVGEVAYRVVSKIKKIVEEEENNLINELLKEYNDVGAVVSELLKLDYTPLEALEVTARVVKTL